MPHNWAQLNMYPKPGNEYHNIKQDSSALQPYNIVF